MNASNALRGTFHRMVALVALGLATGLPTCVLAVAPPCPDPVFIVAFDGPAAISCPRPKMQFDYFSTYATSFSVLQFGTGSGALPMTWSLRANGSAPDSPINVVMGDANSDFPLEADFNGDGRIDLAVFDATNQLYRYRLSNNPQVEQTISWGTSPADNVFAVGDYDCDGITDPTYVHLQGTTYEWHIRTSSPLPDRIVNFGTTTAGNTDIALSGADYTGDGCDDLVYITYPTNGGSTPTKFHIGNASTGALLFEKDWGIFASDYVVPGDYLGDGRADFVAGRTGATSTSPITWMIAENGGAGTLTVSFGVSADIPLRGDFDGDGKDDLAVKKSGTNIWMWRRSSDGVTDQTTVGTAANFPIPSAGTH